MHSTSYIKCQWKSVFESGSLMGFGTIVFSRGFLPLHSLCLQCLSPRFRAKRTSSSWAWAWRSPFVIRSDGPDLPEGSPDSLSPSLPPLPHALSFWNYSNLSCRQLLANSRIWCISMLIKRKDMEPVRSKTRAKTMVLYKMLTFIM